MELETQAAFDPASFEPVSYTHLDVYKRQLAAHVHSLLHLACRAGAGHHDAALVDDVLADLGVEAGSNDEGSTSLSLIHI